MNFKALRNFDLNALLTLKVLPETKHVTRASEQLNLTQSAVSRSLGRLREQLDDPVLVRSGKGMVLSKKAESLLPELNHALEKISHIIAPSEFDPKFYEGTIRLATTDYGTHTLMPRLVPMLQEEAPSLKISAVDWRSNLLTELEENRVDLMIGGVINPPPNIHQRIVSSDQFLGVLRKDHPFAKGITIDEYLSLKHVIISSAGTGTSQVDDYLSEQGLKRQVVVTVPHFFAALEIVSVTDYMILLPSHFVGRYVDTERFAILDAPFAIESLQVAMFWHARTHHDPANKWFRKFVYEKLYARSKRNTVIANLP